ncbi:MAG: hypothetical protein RL637_987 [Pseudomonadota bacterium]|jgi:multidrug efflux pump subunit AcrA (membrane-fusion protein)
MHPSPFNSDNPYFSESKLSQLPEAVTAPLAGRIARSLLWLLLLLIVFLAMTPWQQNIRGVGRVIAYLPAERQQAISAPVEGRIAQWLVKEGTVVKKGQIIAQLFDNDPLILERLQSEQLALLERQQAVNSRVATFREQLRMSELARPQALSAAQSRIAMAKQREQAARQTLLASEAAVKTATLNLIRHKQLQSKGLSSDRTLELTQLEMTQREAELIRSQAGLQSAISEVAALEADFAKLSADTFASIQKARAELNKAIEDQNYVKADLLKLQSKMAKQKNLTVSAPREGTILRLLANPNAELLKGGQAIAILIPHTEQRAVELWVDGNDLPLVITGSSVRLQFEGYPSIQFGGWPEFSMGSFGGKVSLIDSTDDGKGHFRLLITPDPKDLPWPSERFLRQGVRTNGWVLLGRVTLGYELWRIFNNFPPLVLPEHSLDKPDKAKNNDYEADKKKDEDKADEKY